jgi:ribosomal protein L30E
MPIVDGQYQAKISTTFGTTEQALDAIKERIIKAKKVRISNIPMALLDKLLSFLKEKDVKIILPANEKPTDQLKQICSIAVQKAKIYKDYKGTEANLGSIYFSDRTFSIAWTKDKILEIDAMDYGKCVKCMANMFDVGWRYSEKQK